MDFGAVLVLMQTLHLHWVASAQAWDRLVFMPLPDNTGCELAVHSKRIRFPIALLPSCPFPPPSPPCSRYDGWELFHLPY